MAKKYGIRNLKPKETCHFEDDGTEYNPLTVEQQQLIQDTLANNSKLWNMTKDVSLRNHLKQANDTIRSVYSLKK